MRIARNQDDRALIGARMISSWSDWRSPSPGDCAAIHIAAAAPRPTDRRRRATDEDTEGDGRKQEKAPREACAP
jgi:hypothetical protein